MSDRPAGEAILPPRYRRARDLLVRALAGTDFRAPAPDPGRALRAVRRAVRRAGLRRVPVVWRWSCHPGDSLAHPGDPLAMKRALPARALARALATEASAARILDLMPPLVVAEGPFLGFRPSQTNSVVMASNFSSSAILVHVQDPGTAGSNSPLDLLEVFIDQSPGVWAWRALRVVLPLAEAFLCGGSRIQAVGGELVLWERPRIWSDGRRLHREDGPAVIYGDGGERFFWRGTEVPVRHRWIFGHPDRLTGALALSQENLEVRRVMIERMGYGRFLADVKATTLHRDDYGVLYRVTLPGEPEHLVVVKVINSTPEPDGSYKDYFLRVPPTTRTAREAVAWTFNLEPGWYQPEVET